MYTKEKIILKTLIVYLIMMLCYRILKRRQLNDLCPNMERLSLSELDTYSHRLRRSNFFFKHMSLAIACVMMLHLNMNDSTKWEIGFNISIFVVGCFGVGAISLANVKAVNIFAWLFQIVYIVCGCGPYILYYIDEACYFQLFCGEEVEECKKRFYIQNYGLCFAFSYIFIIKGWFILQTLVGNLEELQRCETEKKIKIGELNRARPVITLDKTVNDLELGLLNNQHIEKIKLAILLNKNEDLRPVDENNNYDNMAMLQKINQQESQL